LDFTASAETNVASRVLSDLKREGKVYAALINAMEKKWPPWMRRELVGAGARRRKIYLRARRKTNRFAGSRKSGALGRRRALRARTIDVAAAKACLNGSMIPNLRALSPTLPDFILESVRKLKAVTFGDSKRLKRKTRRDIRAGPQRIVFHIRLMKKALLHSARVSTSGMI